MKKFVAFALGLSIAALSAAALNAAARPSWETANASRVQLMDENGRSFCGGTAVGVHTILTAAHCLVDEDLATIQIDGKPAGLAILAEDGKDHTLLSTTLTLLPAARASSLAVGEAVTQMGLPRGMGPLLKKGYYMGPVFTGNPEYPRLLLFDFPATGGDSGSGIFNSKAQLVAVLSVTLRDGQTTSWGPVGAMPLEFTPEQWKLIE